MPHDLFFLLTDRAPPEISTLSLHDALPIYTRPPPAPRLAAAGRRRDRGGVPAHHAARDGPRSEEHTSELQSRFDLVCRLLLEKKKKPKPPTPPLETVLSAILL